MITPRKFVYEQTAFMGQTYWIELRSSNRLYLQKSTSCIPFFLDCEIFSEPSSNDWGEFREKLECHDFTQLNEIGLCDGTIVDFWCTFRRKLKFSIHLGNNSSLLELHKILNPLTVCDDFPEGLFFDDGWDCIEIPSYPTTREVISS